MAEPSPPTTAEPTQGVDFHQVARPRDLVLLDEVFLPDGKRLGGARARVYSLLEETRARRLSWRIGRHTGPPGAVPTHILCEPWSGGMEGGKRVRELRKLFGCKVDLEPYVTPEGRVSSTWLYRLAGTPGAGHPPANQPAQPPTHPEEETEGGAAHHSPPAAPPSAHPPPLQALSAWLVKGDSGELAAAVNASGTFCVSPGCPCWLAPSAALAERVATGELGTQEATEAYRQELLGHYRSGRLLRELARHRRIVLWTTPFALDPLPMLARALEALGAKVLWDEGSI